MDSPLPAAGAPFVEVDRALVAPLLRDLDLTAVSSPTEATGAAGLPALLLGVARGTPLGEGLGETAAGQAGAVLAADGALLLFLEGAPGDRDLAALRNGLWPELHVGAIYRLTGGRCRRRTLGGAREVEGTSETEATVLAAWPRTHALSPEQTVLKFDQNASGWNGEPGTPGYPHFRWMRRFVACFAPIPFGSRILDFGCGAGWCGIEAARRYRASELAFFDPSAEMIRIAERNAHDAGIATAHGRTGFGESPPFPGEGEQPFDAVISSGVISFAPDPERWLDGLAGTVAPGGLLVIGDIHHDSLGNRRRRSRKPLLPGRELNALTPGRVREGLARRGFEHVESAGYQLTRPFPEAMHVNETRLGGVLTWPLLWCNQVMAAASRRFGLPREERFDSWVMCLRRA